MRRRKDYSDDMNVVDLDLVLWRGYGDVLVYRWHDLVHYKFSRSATSYLEHNRPLLAVVPTVCYLV